MSNLFVRNEATNINPRNATRLLQYLPLLIILSGIVLRLLQYFSNRSLWGDEAYLALNIVNRSYLELLQPLDYNQAAPPGFLWIEKLAIQLFGNSEYSLRLFPLVASIVSLFALLKLGRWGVSAIALPLALAFFAYLRHILYYATEVKQYSSDIMVGLLLCLLLIPHRGEILNKGKLLLVGVLGAVAIWFSHPAIFVLGGIEAANLFTTKAEHRIKILLNRLPIYCLWAVSFAALYFITIAGVMKNQALQGAWGPEYPASVFDVLWLLDSLGRFFYRPLGFVGKTDGIAILIFIIGVIVFVRNQRTKFLILVAPIAATLVASYLHKYPFRGRLVLFLTPFLILIIAEGLAFLLSQFQTRRKYLAIIGMIATGFLLLPPMVQAGKLVVTPRTVQEVRPVVEYIKTHQQPGDVIYLNDGVAVHQFMYYAGKYADTRFDYVPGYPTFLNSETFSPHEWSTFQQQTPQLQSRSRVWFLFSGLKDAQEALVQPRLDQIGQKLDYFRAPGAFTYLYQLK